MNDRRAMRSLGALFALALVSCAPASVERAPASPAVAHVAEQAITHVLDDWHDAAAKADRARYFGHLAEDAIFLGTDATERWGKAAFLAYATPHFAKGKAWSFRATRRAITLDPAGTLAWFDEDLATAGLGPARGSGVLAWRGGRWQILQYNLTITVPNERFDPAKEAAGEAALLAGSGAGALAKIGWLAGAWVGTTPDGEQTEESWLPAEGGTMVGVGRSTKAGATVFFEPMRLVERDGRLVYLAQPNGKAETDFIEASGSAPGEVIFENRAHDWPKRIAYKKIEGGLSVRVEGDPGQPSEAWTLRPAVVVRGRAEGASR